MGVGISAEATRFWATNSRTHLGRLLLVHAELLERALQLVLEEAVLGAEGRHLVVVIAARGRQPRCRAAAFHVCGVRVADDTRSDERRPRCLEKPQATAGRSNWWPRNDQSSRLIDLCIGSKGWLDRRVMSVRRSNEMICDGAN